MNKPPRAGKPRFLCAASRLLRVLTALIVVSSVLFPVRAEAASWQWSSLPGRERIEFRFDRPQKDASATRTGTTQLTIQLGAPASGFTGSGAGTLVRGVGADGESLRLSLRDPAFGYVVSRPNSTTMRVDVFADALGARWKGKDTSTAPAVSAATPATPAVTTPPTTPLATSTAPARNNTAQNATGQNITSQTASARNATAQTSPVSAAGLTTPSPAVSPNPPAVIGALMPRSPAAATSNVPPGEFVPLGPAPLAVTEARNDNRTNGNATATGNATTTSRVDPRTVGRMPLSNGRNVMAGPTNATASTNATITNATSTNATVNTSANATAANAPANATRFTSTPLADVPAEQPIDIPKDPEVPMPTTSDLSRITDRIEALGVGEPRPDNALGSVRGRIDPKQTPRGTVVPAPGVVADQSPSPTAQQTSSTTPAQTPPAQSSTTPASPVQSSVAERQPMNQVSGSFRQSMSNAAPAPADAGSINTTAATAPVPSAPVPAASQPVRSEQPPATQNGRASTPRSTAEKWGMTADHTATVRAVLPSLSEKARPATQTPPASATPVTPPVTATVADASPAIPTPAGNAFRGRMMRPGDVPESTPATPAISATPATPAIPETATTQSVTPAPPATATAQPVAPAPTATVAAVTPPATPSKDVVPPPANAQRQSLRQSLNPADETAPVAPASSPAPTALAQEKNPPIVSENSVVQHTRTTTAPAVVGGKSATESAMTAAPYAVEPDPEARQMLSGSGVLGKNTEPKPDDAKVIYVDEKGNVVDKPPDIPAMMKEVQQQMNNLQFQTALDLLVPIKDMVLPPETREQVLYSISECLNNLYKDKPLEGYEPITKATSEAMNFNLASERVPEALYRLGVLNLRVGNQQDAAGYFGAMRNRYPYAETVPYGYFGLGQDQLKNKQYAEAVRSFQTVMDEYPESKAVRDSARGMAEALYRQGHYDRAQILVDFVDRRWPRIYLDDPTYLPMVGEIQTRMQDYDNALQTYWTSYNLTPDAPDNHKILLQIGAIYLQSGFTSGARRVFAELLRKYPQSASAPKAVLLMAEQGFAKDNPTLDEMFTIFGRPGDMPVEAAYRRLMNEFPASPEAFQAELRDAALSYWNGDTDDAMTKAQAFMGKYPETPESERAREIILRGFTRTLELAKQEENYERILSQWEKYPQVQLAYPNPDDDMRVAMARARLNRGDEAAGLADLAPFLDKPQGKYSDYVYNLFLAKYLQDSNWNGILDLGEKVKDWKMPSDVRNQLDYSRAISAENLGMKARALPIWDRLHSLPDGELPLYQKAYAAYFMAREAENRRDLKDAYDLNLRTLDLFTTLEEEHSDKADPERMRESLAGLMDVTEVAGRFAEALEWTERYKTFVPQDSPDYAGLLFRQARLHRKMGDMARWRSLLDTIVQREPDSVFGRMAASELRTQEVSRNLTRFTEQPGQSATQSSANTPAPQTGAQGAQPAGQAPAAPAAPAGQ